MNMAISASELRYGSDAYSRKNKNKNTEPAVSSPVVHLSAVRSEFSVTVITKDQIRRLNSRYKLTDMTCEEEESLIQDLIGMDILTVDDGCSYTKSGGNVLESLTKQLSANINLLYQMAIAGRFSNLHIEIIKSQQKIMDILEQLLAEQD
ncbi:MAG TPA: hypothetical protein VN381_13590 [Anaerovoracaceae bacterium]|nr:hypothetical protein [Anaerovoracaceae bacterium]